MHGVAVTDAAGRQPDEPCCGPVSGPRVLETSGHLGVKASPLQCADGCSDHEIVVDRVFLLLRR